MYDRKEDEEKLELLENIPEEIQRNNRCPNLNLLKKVIPVASQITSESVTITMPSLEIYDEGFRVYLYVKGKSDSLDFNSSGFTHLMPSVTVQDDLGNSYDVISSGGGGSASQNEFNYDWQLQGMSINPHAKELVITINEILFQGMFPPSSITDPSVMTEFRYSADTKLPPFLTISGPWKFKIKLD